MIGAINTKHI